MSNATTALKNILSFCAKKDDAPLSAESHLSTAIYLLWRETSYTPSGKEAKEALDDAKEYAKMAGYDDVIVEPGVYTHESGCDYEVLHVGRNSDDAGQMMVVLKSLQDAEYPAGTVWTKPLNGFLRKGRFVKKV